MVVVDEAPKLIVSERLFLLKVEADSRARALIARLAAYAAPAPSRNCAKIDRGRSCRSCID